MSDALPPVVDLSAARARASRWPVMSFVTGDGVIRTEPCWSRIVDVVVSEVQLPPALVESFACPLPTPLPPRRDLSFAVAGVPLAAEVLDARSRPGRCWALRLWLWGPERATVVE